VAGARRHAAVARAHRGSGSVKDFNHIIVAWGW
jgi:hypothetical protein